jgi:hypothetical protein
MQPSGLQGNTIRMRKLKFNEEMSEKRKRSQLLLVVWTPTV